MVDWGEARTRFNNNKVQKILGLRFVDNLRGKCFE